MFPIPSENDRFFSFSEGSEESMLRCILEETETPVRIRPDPVRGRVTEFLLRLSAGLHMWYSVTFDEVQNTATDELIPESPALGKYRILRRWDISTALPTFASVADLDGNVQKSVVFRYPEGQDPQVIVFDEFGHRIGFADDYPEALALRQHRMTVEEITTVHATVMSSPSYWLDKSFGVREDHLRAISDFVRQFPKRGH